MRKGIISRKQAVSIMTMFILGNSLVLGTARNSKQDSWIAFLIAMVAILPMIYIYLRLVQRYPGKDLFDICIDLFGRVVGRIIIVLFVLYSLQLGALVLRIFSEFIQITTFDQMPQTISLLSMILLVIWITRRGIETLGRWSTIALPVMLITVAATFLLLIKDMHPSFLLPIGENLQTVPKDAWADFAFPLADTVLFLGVSNALKPEDKPGKAWVYSILLGGFTLLFGSFFRNAMVLGFPLHGSIEFPSYGAVSVIIASSFISRIENVVGANLLIAGFVKITICLLVTAKGTAKLFAVDECRGFVAPLGLLMVALAGVLYENIMKIYAFAEIYSYFAFPFQVLLPILLCLAAEIKFIVKSRKDKGGESGKEPIEET